MPTLGDLVAQVQGHLNQYLVNRPMTGTFKEWVLDGSSNKIGVKLADISIQGKLNNVLVELSTGELVQVSSYDANSQVATCPPWFRGQLGTPQADSVAADSRIVVEPLWPLYHVAQKLVDGINALYPDLFQVKEETLTSGTVTSNYEVPEDADGILNITVENLGPAQLQQKIWQWTLDTSNADGNRYLRIPPLTLPGRPIYVTYRAQPVVPLASDLAATWTSTGLPDSASDLPVLHAVASLIPGTDLAKTQVHSAEQSDRNRLVQPGSANAASRRYEELFRNRLAVEKRKLLDRFPPRMHKQLNG